jgi:type III restriction enzyme
MAKTKTKINATLGDFLFNQIENDPAYQMWERSFSVPEYITDNLSKTLREYQVRALKHFIWLYESDRAKAKHLLFNMATGTGKTLVMASVVLYLFANGYRNFLFLVHQIQIKDQALKNFTDYKFEKYLFNPKGVKINGHNVAIKVVPSIADADSNAINFMFFSTSLLYNRLTEDKENGLTAQDFADNNVVILAVGRVAVGRDVRDRLARLVVRRGERGRRMAGEHVDRVVAVRGHAERGGEVVQRRARGQRARSDGRRNDARDLVEAHANAPDDEVPARTVRCSGVPEASMR